MMVRANTTCDLLPPPPSPSPQGKHLPGIPEFAGLKFLAHALQRRGQRLERAALQQEGGELQLLRRRLARRRRALGRLRSCSGGVACRGRVLVLLPLSVSRRVAVAPQVHGSLGGGGSGGARGARDAARSEH